MTTKTNEYHAVAEVRCARDRLAKQMADMSSEDKLAFIHQEAQKARSERLMNRRSSAQKRSDDA